MHPPNLSNHQGRLHREGDYQFSDEERCLPGNKNELLLDHLPPQTFSLTTVPPPSQGAIVDTNEALVDENLVQMKKVGGAKYYWSFPGKKDRDQLTKVRKTEEDERESERHGNAFDFVRYSATRLSFSSPFSC